MIVQTNNDWIESQFAQCDLGNRARTRRLKKVASAMVASPEQSLPKQNSAWPDLKAAYRLFDNPHVTFDAIAQPHWDHTRQTAPGRYLLISDTTDIDHYSHPATKGLGMLGGGEGRGMQLHSCLIFNRDRDIVEGIAGGMLYYRSKTSKTESRSKRLNRLRESSVWGNVVEQVGGPPDGCQWIHVFDRGGDNYEAMCHIHLTQCDYVIRAAKWQRKVITESGETIPLKKAVTRGRQLGSYDLDLRSRPGVKKRTAHIDVSVLKVTFPRPRQSSRWVKQCGVDELQVNVVVVQEKNAPKGVPAINWVLLTSLPIETLDDAWQVIGDYENRWVIEEFHKVIKTGCSVEKHALRTADRLEPLIGLISVIGTRLLNLKYLGRNDKTVRAANHVPKSWLKCLKLAKPKVKITTMTVYQFFRELAKLGGFLARKGDGEPGWQTIWHGYQKLQSLLDGIRLLRPI